MPSYLVEEVLVTVASPANPTAVVSGAAGFIGSHMCRRLTSEGYRVVGIDNLSTGSMTNIEDLIAQGEMEFLRQDVSTPVLLDGEVDLVLHLASPASPDDFERLPIQILKVGGLGTHNMLGLAKAKSARFLLASTSEVYGDPLVHPQPESYWGNVNPLGPRGVYDEAKRYAEAMTMAYHAAHGVNVCIARIFNTYGPRMRIDDGRVVTNFIASILRDEPLTVYGAGSQSRTFCYIDDQVEGLFRLINSSEIGPINIGGTQEITIRALAEKLIELSESESAIENRPLPQDDPKRRCPDLTLAQSLLGWSPETSLEDGLKATLDHFRQTKSEI